MEIRGAYSQSEDGQAVDGYNTGKCGFCLKDERVATNNGHIVTFFEMLIERGLIYGPPTPAIVV